MTPDKMPTVKYWKYGDAAEAMVTKTKDGIQMKIAGEDYPMATFPRSYLLMGPLSPFKHQIKNQVFNEAWALIESGKTNKEVVAHIKGKLFGPIAELFETLKYDQVPENMMCLAVREIYRAWGKVTKDPRHLRLRDYLCFVLQEDDGYRFRVQWLTNYFPPKWVFRILNPAKFFAKALKHLEHAEVVGDMKERILLLRTVLLVLLTDPKTAKLFNALFREIDWRKVKLSEADKYYFRAKYFKVDHPYLEY